MSNKEDDEDRLEELERGAQCEHECKACDVHHTLALRAVREIRVLRELCEKQAHRMDLMSEDDQEPSSEVPPSGK